MESILSKWLLAAGKTLSHCHLDTEGLKQSSSWHRLSPPPLPVTTGRLALSSCLSQLTLLLINQGFSNKEQAYLRVPAGLWGSSPAATVGLPRPPAQPAS